MRTLLFREVLTVGLVAVGVGLLVYREPAGALFLPLVGLALRYWFARGGGNGGSTAGGDPADVGGAMAGDGLRPGGDSPVAVGGGGV